MMWLIKSTFWVDFYRFEFWVFNLPDWLWHQSWRAEDYVKCKQFCSKFELESPCPHPITVTFTLRTPPSGTSQPVIIIIITIIITKTIQVRRTRHAGHCWRSRDELISDVLLWIPTHGRAKAGRPARTCIQQLCEDTECSPEDLPEAMNDREK